MSSADWVERWRRATSPGRVTLAARMPELEGASCVGMETELWFTSDPAGARVARDVCGACRVRERCLEFALAERIAFGIWGGLDERERVRLIEERRAAARRDGRRVS